MYTGYEIQFTGSLTLDRPLLPQHFAYLNCFVQIRHVTCSVEHLQDVPDPLREAVGLPLGPEGAYFVGINFDKENIRQPIVLKINKPPQAQPYLWCHWQLDPDGLTLKYADTWNLYRCHTWLQYLMDHFLTPWGYRLNGEVHWQGENEADHGRIIVQESIIEIRLEQRGESKQLAWPGEPIACVHRDAYETRLVCTHLAGQSPDSVYYRWFTGKGHHFYMVCHGCYKCLKRGDTTIELGQICWRCHKELEEEGDWEGIVGRPEVFERFTTLSIAWQRIPFPVSAPICDIQPIDTQQESTWIALTFEGDLLGINLTTHTVTHLMHLPDSKLDLNQQISLHIAPRGQFAAIVNTRGQYGIVLGLSTGEVTMQLARDTSHIKHSRFPIAFFEIDDRLLLVHGTRWNRLDISDPRTGDLISARPSPPYKRGQPYSEHYLDYFHSGLSVSPDQEWIADNGWMWNPTGQVIIWNLRHRIRENVWESEDGPSRKNLCQRQYYWDGPLCWIDSHALAVWGYGDDEELLIPAVRLFNVTSGEELPWFAGPEGTLIFDEYLFSLSQQHGISAWDVATGERVLLDNDFRPTHYHRGAKQFLCLDAQDGTIYAGTVVQ